MFISILKKVGVTAGIALLTLSTSVSAGPIGSIDLDTTNGVVGTGAWTSGNGGFSISSQYEILSNSVRYSYEVGGLAGGLTGSSMRELYIQTTDGATNEELILNRQFDQTGASLLLVNAGLWSPSNLPVSNIYGLRLEIFPSADSFTFEFESSRMPMLGNFYASADASNTYAYNNAITGGDAEIWVPDTLTVSEYHGGAQWNWENYEGNGEGGGGNGPGGSPPQVEIPEPGTYLMLGSMLCLVGYLRRRREVATTA